MLNNSVVDGRIIQINLATPKVNYGERRNRQLSAQLASAELRLAKATMEVNRIREEFNRSLNFQLDL